MTATQPATKSTSRRAVLAGALGGLGALAASALGRPAPTHAQGENIVVGGSYNTATSVTYLENTANTADVFGAESTHSGIGVHGKSSQYRGVEGSSTSGTGVYGYSSSHIGVYGITDASSVGTYGVFGTGGEAGVYGTSGLGSGPGVYGDSGTSFGVYGHGGMAGVYGISVSGDGVQGIADAADKSGVYGNNTGGGYGVAGSSSSDGSRAGVWGHNGATGVGVRGTTISGAGVFGYSSAATIPSAPAKVGVYGYASQDSSARGVIGETTTGHGIHGIATTGFAGYFAGKVYVSKFQEMPQISTPAAPAANKARLFVRDNGSGKTQLCVRFPTGAVQVIKTEL